MELIWTKTAKKNLKTLWYRVPIEAEKSTKKYILGLIQYIEILKNNPNLGKRLFQYEPLIVKQLIYRKHKIIYQVKEEIYILTIISNVKNVKFS